MGRFAEADRYGLLARGWDEVGAGIQAGTILKYGGYFPAGTAFPKGVIVPLHARMGEFHFALSCARAKRFMC